MKPLDQWARYYGYNDFDTFVRAGGSIIEAVRDIEKRLGVLQNALTEIAGSLRCVRQPPVISPEAVTEDEPTDPEGGERSENAHVQGAELG